MEDIASAADAVVGAGCGGGSSTEMADMASPGVLNSVETVWGMFWFCRDGWGGGMPPKMA
jgi:hypothetical protein